MTQEITTKNDIRSFLAGDKFKEQIALALPRHISPDRFARVALTALTRTPKLMDCTRESLLKCLMDCSALGLEPDGRHAHLIPYGKDCTLICDWKGLVALARRSGKVALWGREVGKEADTFGWDNGIVSRGINWRGDRGKAQCYYSHVRSNDGTDDYEVMTMEEVKAIQKRSRAGSSGPWVTDFDEMARKTVLRRHSKRITLSPEFADALERDDDRIVERHVTGRTIPANVPALSPAKKEQDDFIPEPAAQEIPAEEEEGLGHD